MSLSIEDRTFLANLSMTSKSNTLIREDGQKLGLGTRFCDVFRRVHNSDHLEKVCKKLNALGLLIDEEQKLEILARMKQIKSKIGLGVENKGINELTSCIKKLDENLKREKHLTTIPAILTNLANASSSHDEDQVNSCLTKLSVLVINEKISIEELKTVINHRNEMSIESEAKITPEISAKIDNILLISIRTQLQKLESDDDKFNGLSVDFLKISFRLLKNLDKASNFLELKNQVGVFTNFSQHFLSNERLAIDLKSSRGTNWYEAWLPELKPVAESFASKFLKSAQKYFQDVFELNTKRVTFSELKKNHLLSYHGFFRSIETALGIIKESDRSQFIELKVVMANLPCRNKHSDYKLLFLTEREQVEHLILKIQKAENIYIENITRRIKEKGISEKQVKILAKLCNSKSYLSEKNREQLREAIHTHVINIYEKLGIEQAKINKIKWDWDNQENISENMLGIITVQHVIFEKNAKITSGLEKYNEIDLKRLAKTKRFFEKQLESGVFSIPLWYHCTHKIGPAWFSSKKRGVEGIIEKGEIEVRHEKLFRGAWVSTTQESTFGDYGFALKHSLTKDEGDLDDVNIGLVFSDRRWRGIQKPIEIKNAFAFVIVPNNPEIDTTINQTAQKIDKLALIKHLKEKNVIDESHNSEFLAISTNQAKNIIDCVRPCLGTPNLSYYMWGSDEYNPDFIRG